MQERDGNAQEQCAEHCILPALQLVIARRSKAPQCWPTRSSSFLSGESFTIVVG
jgi:hypothetical protein